MSITLRGGKINQINSLQSSLLSLMKGGKCIIFCHPFWKPQSSVTLMMSSMSLWILHIINITDFQHLRSSGLFFSPVNPLTKMMSITSQKLATYTTPLLLKLCLLAKTITMECCMHVVEKYGPITAFTETGFCRVSVERPWYQREYCGRRGSAKI